MGRCYFREKCRPSAPYANDIVGTAPSVMCIDINGNREIDGVLECLRMVMNEPWSSMPRMIIVKSRFLYWEMKKMEESWGGW